MLTHSPDPSDSSTRRQPPGLTVEERRHLLAWAVSARSIGIDATEDLRMRPWPVPVTANVIGVFRADERMASWMVVGQNGAWTVVSVSESSVLTTTPTLAEALTAIHRPAERDLTGYR